MIEVPVRVFARHRPYFRGYHYFTWIGPDKRMPQNKKIVVIEILVFGFELFIGGLRAGETSYLLEGRDPIGKTGSALDNLLTRLVNTTP